MKWAQADDEYHGLGKLVLHIVHLAGGIMMVYTSTLLCFASP